MVVIAIARDAPVNVIARDERNCSTRLISRDSGHGGAGVKVEVVHWHVSQRPITLAFGGGV
jgi:hypothetical protein